MKRFTFALLATALLAGAGYAQAADEPEAQPADPNPAIGVFADADGDGIPNHADEDFVRPASGRGARLGARGQFVDENGDGINDRAPDADGDGIVNHLDPDFVRPGLGQGQGQGRRGRAHGPGTFVDADGDGINDLAPDADGDGIANCLDEDYQRPGLGPDGSGTTARGGRGPGRSGQGRGRR